VQKFQWTKLIALTLFLSVFCAKTEPELNFSPAKNEIQTIMDEQKAAWNAGSVEGFMKYYWQSEDFTFQGGNRRLQGWNELFAMYKKNYAGENMGQLDFSDIEINVIAENYAYVLGRWRVTLKDSSKEGLFTLIFKKFNVGWRIIVDHSSSA
jgi:uncharacterized protein (TIGR02246 family)